MNSGQYAKAFVALATVAEAFITTQWPHGKYTIAAMAGIGAALVYLVPNAGKTTKVDINSAYPSEFLKTMYGKHDNSTPWDVVQSVQFTDDQATMGVDDDGLYPASEASDGPTE